MEAWALVRWVGAAPGVYPAISALHLLGIAFLIAPVALVDLRLLGLLGPALDAARPALVRASLAGFALAVPTGAAMFAVQAETYLGNPAFLLKLGLVAAAGANAALLAWRGGPGRVAAALSLALWLGAVFAGRWIAFV